MENQNAQKKFSCEVCLQTFDTKYNMMRHMRTVHHKPTTKTPTLTGCFCQLEITRFETLKTHFSKHSQKLHKLCIYCRAGFPNVETFQMHMMEAHSLPLFEASEESSKTSNVTASNSALKEYELKGGSNDNILDFMVEHHETILRLISANVIEAPRKIQFSLSIFTSFLMKKVTLEQPKFKQTQP